LETLRVSITQNLKNIMIEKVFLAAILIFFILAFAVRNIKTYLATKQSIKGKSVKLSLSILLSTIIYVLILSRISFLNPHWILELHLPFAETFRIAGLVLVSIGFLFGIFALIAMQNSWRIGIKYDQKTDLVTSGIYRFSRNPYFFSYDVLIFGYILIFPSLLLMGLLVGLSITFHLMILEEEQYLSNSHGNEYIAYQKRVSRYITFFNV